MATVEGLTPEAAPVAAPATEKDPLIPKDIEIQQDVDGEASIDDDDDEESISTTPRQLALIAFAIVLAAGVLVLSFDLYRHNHPPPAGWIPYKEPKKVHMNELKHHYKTDKVPKKKKKKKKHHKKKHNAEEEIIEIPDDTLPP